MKFIFENLDDGTPVITVTGKNVYGQDYWQQDTLKNVRVFEALKDLQSELETVKAELEKVKEERNQYQIDYDSLYNQFVETEERMQKAEAQIKKEKIRSENLKANYFFEAKNGERYREQLKQAEAKRDELKAKLSESDQKSREWLSPIDSERMIQEQKLLEIYPDYPNGAPLWQYMNGLLNSAVEKSDLVSKKEVLEWVKKNNWYSEDNEFCIDLCDFKDFLTKS